MANQQKSLPNKVGEMAPTKRKQALILLLNPFLYAAILITTSTQYASDPQSNKQSPSTPDALMMSIEANPLSNYSKTPL